MLRRMSFPVDDSGLEPVAGVGNAGGTDPVFERVVVQFPGGIRCVGRVQVEQFRGVALVCGHERRLLDGLDQQRVAAYRPDDCTGFVGRGGVIRDADGGVIRDADGGVVRDADDTGDAGRVVVVLLEVEREQGFGESVSRRVAQREFLRDRVDVRAVAKHRAAVGPPDAVVGNVGVVRLRGVGRRANRYRPVALGCLPVRERPRGDPVRADRRAGDEEPSNVHGWWLPREGKSLAVFLSTTAGSMCAGKTRSR